jgi:hypothetical protein
MAPDVLLATGPLLLEKLIRHSGRRCRQRNDHTSQVESPFEEFNGRIRAERLKTSQTELQATT